MNEPLIPETGGGLVRIRIDLGYDGTGFRGWAIQPQLRTVQGVVEDALKVLFASSERIAVNCAGRTDAGVHARGQVAHADVSVNGWSRHEEEAARRLNGLLPADVNVYDVRRAPPGFEARFSALTRRYSYTIFDGVGHWDPVARTHVLRHRIAGGRRLDLAAMNAASQQVLGEHDFAAFCRQRERATTVRTLHDLSWRRGEDGLVRGEVIADAFCHSMVRSLVGALLVVGDGHRGPEWPGELLRSKAGTATRAENFRVAPPCGLVLEEVTYPNESDQMSAELEREPEREPGRESEASLSAHAAQARLARTRRTL